MAETLDDARRLLETLQLQQASRNPELYRQLALYLQVLRDGLLTSVRQACFHLATEEQPDRYLMMLPSQRQRLQRRIEALVARARSLLTVEQVAQLACQLRRDRLAALSRAASSPAQDPPGSVALSLDPPIQWPALALEAPDPLLARDDLEAHSRGMLQTVVEALAPVDDGNAAALPPWDSGRLPQDPSALQVWLEAFDEALERRLRNLSHAINVELMRAGLSIGVLPMPMLEAVLQGRLELHSSVPNLVRIPMAGPDPLLILLRSSDLELVQPPLRTCRGRWRALLAEVRKMAEHSRRLKRRVQVLEAQQQWLNDINSPPS